jgi:4-hydroxy-3-polyprenylbenzoate decarboxylase
MIQLADQVRALLALTGTVGIADNLPFLVIGLNQREDSSAVRKILSGISESNIRGVVRLIFALDHTVDTDNLFMVAWQLLGNTDPARDIDIISADTLFIDGTIKAFRKEGFPREWPNIVCSSEETIKAIDQKWDSLDIGELLPSPSAIYSRLSQQGTDVVLVKS